MTQVLPVTAQTTRAHQQQPLQQLHQPARRVQQVQQAQVQVRHRQLNW